MRIKRLQEEDIEAYWKIRLEALYRYPESFGASYDEAKETPLAAVRESFVSSDSNFILGAFGEENQLIGMVGFRQEVSQKVRHKGKIWGMYVDQAYQGQGVGKQLLRKLLQAVKTLSGLEQIHLFVVESNLPAKRLYESHGFQTYGIEIHAMKLDEQTYVNEELMVKSLVKG